jgi:hypothetical protein
VSLGRQGAMEEQDDGDRVTGGPAAAETSVSTRAAGVRSTRARPAFQPRRSKPDPGGRGDPGPGGAAGQGEASATAHWAGAAALLRPLGVYAASRLVVLVVFATAATVLSAYGDGFSARPWPIDPEERNVTMRALTSWDGGWYIHLAEHGYPRDTAPAALAFFPAYPLVVRALARLTGLRYATAGVVIVWVCGAAAAVLLWELSRRLGGRRFADRSVLLFSFFPGSFVFSMTYAEPLMLAASLGCLVALQRRAWVWAGTLAGVATAARPNAVVLVACCAWAAGAALREARGWRPLIAPLLSVVGVFSYYGFLWASTGNPIAWFSVQRNLWNERLAPGNMVRRAETTVEQVVRGHQPDVGALLATLGFVFCVVGFVLLVRWRPPAALTIYAVGVVVLAFTAGNIGVRPRFVATAFPLLQAVAWWAKGMVFTLAVGISAVLLAGLAFISVLPGMPAP